MKIKSKVLGLVALCCLSSAVQAGEATLAWNASPSPSVEGYKLYRGTTSKVYQLVATLGNVLTATDPGLTAGTTYYWVVTAFNSAGESAFSNEASATIPFAKPGPATGLSVTVTP